MLRTRIASNGPTIQTTEAVDFTFPANPGGVYTFDIPITSTLPAGSMCVVTFDNFSFEVLKLGEGIVSDKVLRLSVLYIVDVLAPIPVDLHVQCSAHDLSQVAD